MKSRMILAVSLLTALSATVGLASAQYSRARVKPIKVDYNFEVRNGGHAPIYYRYAEHPAMGSIPSPIIAPSTPWEVLDSKKGFNLKVIGTLAMQLSADRSDENPTTLIFRAKASIGPRSREPRTCFITARVVHPERKVVVTPQNVSEYGRKTGQSMSEHRLPLDRNLTLEEMNRYEVIVPADKVAEYIAPRQIAEPADEPGTSRSHEAAPAPIIKQPDKPEEQAQPQTAPLIDIEGITEGQVSPEPFAEPGKHLRDLLGTPPE